jgi:hypothetical protein
MEVEPIHPVQSPAENVLVPDAFVRDLSVFQCQRDGVVPRLRRRGDVHGHLRGFLQEERVHVALLHDPINVGDIGVPDDLVSHSEELAHLLDLRGLRDKKGAPAIVQEPLDLHAAVQDLVGHAVCPKVVGLRHVHRDQDMIPRRGEAHEYQEN